MKVIEITAGAEIYAAGSTIDRAYWIRSGTIDLVPATPDSQSPVRHLVAGDVFGELALLSDAPQRYSARATCYATLIPLTRDAFVSGVTLHRSTFSDYLRILFAQLSILSPQVPSAELALVKPQPTLTVVIHPLTVRAAATVSEAGMRVDKFPFRMGRAALDEGTNDLWLIDHSPYNISRQHAQLERAGDNVILRDAKSSLGCIVNDKAVGARGDGHTAQLKPGDNVVILGRRQSPFQFRIVVNYD